jgi:hydrogenase maturation protease
MSGTVVIGVGNAARRDDGAGLEVARRLRDGPGVAAAVVECSGDAVALLEAWGACERAIVVDAARGVGAPGAVHRFEAHRRALPAALLATSTHDFGVECAVELARALGRLPPTVVVYAIEGQDFAPGEGLSATVEAAVRELVPRIREEVSHA